MRYYPKSSPGPAFLANRRAVVETDRPVGVAAPASTGREAPNLVLAAPVSDAVIAEKDWAANLNSALRRVGFPIAAVYVFLRFSFLHEILSAYLQSNLGLIAITGTVVSLVAVFGGALQRTFQSRAAQLWAMFTLWMLIDLPFSRWKTDSLQTVMQYARASLVMLVIIAGLTLTLKECYRILSMIALAGVVNILTSADFVEGSTRLYLSFGSIANPNDFAAHLLLVLPFLLWVGLASEWKVLRFMAVLAVLAGIFIGARSGSRGALIAFAIAALYLFVRARAGVRLGVALALPILITTVILVLPQSLRSRYGTLFEDESRTRNEAEESYQARKYLLETSVQLALQNPVFGVGPNEFLITEGDLAKQQGRHGAWQVPHNTYTQVAAESGMPALIFFVGAVLATFGILSRIYRKCAGPELRRCRAAALCLGVSMVGFCTAVFFLSLPYSMYLPAMTGLAIALDRAVDHELRVHPSLVRASAVRTFAP